MTIQQIPRPAPRHQVLLALAVATAVVAALVASGAVVASALTGLVHGNDPALGQPAPAAPTGPRPTVTANGADPVGVALVGRLVEFARGTSGAHVPTGAAVGLYRDGRPVRSLTAAEASDRARYSMCPGFGDAHCTASYLDGVAINGPYTVLGRVPDCFFTQDRVLSRHRGGGAGTVFAYPSGTDVCHAVTVLQIRYDGPEHLVAVNVAAMRPGGAGSTPPDAEQRAAANAFIDFAQGRTDHLPGDLGVALYNTGEPAVTLEAAQARDRTRYSLCGDTPECGMSPTELVDSEPAAPVVTGSAGCLSNSGILGDEPGLESVLVSDHGHDVCSSTWAVELRFDSEGRIRTINEVSTVG